MEKPIDSRLRKEYNRAVLSHPVCLIYMLSTCEKCQAGWVTSWNQDRWENDNNLRYEDTTLMAESEEEMKSLLMRVKEESEKASLKLNIKNN